jgi:toxin-antitoxin system PIN domain toxin
VRPALLDVNVLVALFDPDHVHHDLAHDWFADNRTAGWATCPITECGFVRVLANPAYGASVTRPADLLAGLRRFCASAHHLFWPDTVSLRDDKLFDMSRVGGHRQLTDIYLLGLAKTKRGRLATFDRTIPVRAVVGGQGELLAVISPADEA